MKKTLTCCAIALFLLTVLGCAGTMAETQTGSCGDNLTWTLTDDGALTISGTGKMYSYNYEGVDDEYGGYYTITTAPWKTNITSVKICDGVTGIGRNAFTGCSSLTSVMIPDSVTSIDNRAFFDCRSLTSVTIPDSVTSIGSYAFYGCYGLASVTIPNSITSISADVFGWCKSLTSMTIPDSVTSIGKEAFYGCSGLTSVMIPNSVTSIGADVFGWCKNLTSVTIPDSVTSIGSSAFYCCSGLTNVIISEGVTSIGREAFYGCSGLMSVTIPSSVNSIGTGAFSCCEKMTKINVDSSNTSFCSDNGVLLDKAKTVIIQCPAGMSGIYVIPNNVTSIGKQAFYGCSGLTSVTISDSVTSIGGFAFYGCSNLTRVTIPNSVISIGICAFYDYSNLTIVSEDCTDYAFSWAETNSIPHIALNHVQGEVIYSWAENDSSVTAARVCPHNAEHTETETVNATAAVTVSPGMDTEGRAVWTSNAFTNPAFSVQTKEAALHALGGLRLLRLPAGLKGIEEEAFAGDTFEAVILPDGCTSIGKLAFANCKRLVYIRIPASVTSIAEDAFDGCEQVVIDRQQ